jgi:hypothetical protein
MALLVCIILALLLAAALGRVLNRWWIARRNGWATGWQHVARNRRARS